MDQLTFYTKTSEQFNKYFKNLITTNILLIICSQNMIIRNTPSIEVLDQIYKTIHKIIDNQECYYTPEQIEKLKKNKNNKFLEKRKK